MINAILDFIKKYKLTILIALVIVSIGLVAMFLILKKDLSIKTFKNENYSFVYDSTWKINSENENYIILEHSKGSKLKIEVVSLQEEYKYSTIDEILDDILYNIEEQNQNYKLLYKEQNFITKNKYDGYVMLYETKGSQAMVNVFKKSDKLIMFTYEAENNYFDILLDSVQNIIYNFDALEETFDLNYNLKIETTEINYNNSENVEALLNKTAEYEIATNNYYVKYSLPEQFKLSNINSTINRFNFEGLQEGSINITVNLYNKNIYEHLNKEETLNVYNSYKYISENEDYSNFSESLGKFESDFVSYIYKNSYNYDKAINFDENFNSIYTSELHETIVLMYALDKNHILLFEIESKKISIPEKLINMIKINLSENYSSYSDSIKKDGYIHSILKRKTTEKVEEIKLIIPDKYKEIDKNFNLYESRSYALNYDDEKMIYDYEVEYHITSQYSNLENQIKIYNNFPQAYGEYKNLTYSGDFVFNGKLFKVYDGGFTDITGIMFTSNNREKYYTNVKLLFNELPSGGYLIIKIEGNGFKISDEVVNGLTNFEIKN